MNSPKPLTVFFFPAWYPHRNDPMFGLFVKRHAEAVASLVRAGVVFAIGELRHGPTYDMNHICENGVETISVYYRKSQVPMLGSFLNGIRFLRAVWMGYLKLKSILGKPDVNHVHVLTRAGIVPLGLKVFSGIPYIITEHWSRYLPENKGNFKGVLRKWLTKIIVRHSSFITPVSQKLADAMMAHGIAHPQYRLVNNVVDTDRFLPGNSDEMQCVHWVHVSCFDDRPKNLKGLLDGFKLAHSTDKRLTLNLVGDGIDFEDIRNYGREIDPAGEIFRFSGLREGEELVKAFQQADAFVMFSRYENQPVVIIEAFACGLPVVATDVGAIPQMVAEGRGMAVKSEDVQALCDAILMYAQGTISFSREEIRRYALENFGNRAVADRFRELYLATIQQSKKS